MVLRCVRGSSITNARNTPRRGDESSAEKKFDTGFSNGGSDRVWVWVWVGGAVLGGWIPDLTLGGLGEGLGLAGTWA